MNKRSLQLTFCCIILLETKAMAYLDPGTGSYIFQVLMASFFGIIFVAGNFFEKIKKMIKKSVSKTKREK